MPEKIFSAFKYSVYALLAFNIYLFFRHAALHEGLDAAGWVMLLAMFEWQTRRQGKAPHSAGGRSLLLMWQVAAYGLVLYAWAKYFLHGQWLDFINATLWLGVVISLAADVYAERLHRQWHWLHHGIKLALYGGLVAIAVIWGMQKDILNFYDAFLWILCFFAVELNLLRHVGKPRVSAGEQPWQE